MKLSDYMFFRSFLPNVCWLGSFTEIQILPVTGWLSFSWYNASVISSYIDMICLFFFVRRGMQTFINQGISGPPWTTWMRKTALMSTSQWFVLLGEVDIWLIKRFPLEDDQQSFHLFGTSWLQRNHIFLLMGAIHTVVLNWIPILFIAMKTRAAENSISFSIFYVIQQQGRNNNKESKIFYKNRIRMFHLFRQHTKRMFSTVLYF